MGEFVLISLHHSDIKIVDLRSGRILYLVQAFTEQVRTVS